MCWRSEQATLCARELAGVETSRESSVVDWEMRVEGSRCRKVSRLQLPFGF
jgi:hypothetical protein